MPYTPELSESAICSLRRLAWALNKPMGKVLEEALINRTANEPRDKVCSLCRDNSKCTICHFRDHPKTDKLKKSRMLKRKH